MIATEFALVAPLFFLVALATADLIRVFRAQLRTETIAVQIGQIVSQCRASTQDPAITAGDITNFWTQAGRIAGSVIDVNSASGGAMIISAVRRTVDGSGNPLNENTVSWQRRTGNTSHRTRLTGTAAGNAATISDGFLVPAGQTLLVTEVFAFVRPWTLSAGLIGTVVDSVVYGTTLFLTRAPEPVTLQTAPTASTTASCTA